MRPDPRIALEVAETELLEALCAGGPLPAGFDARALEAASASLARKRARTAVHLVSGLAPSEGELAAFAAGRPFEDALALASAFAATRDLAFEARVELGLAELRTGRRRVLACREGRSFVIAFRLPGLGVRAFRAP
jgi:hypothetical protein